VCKQGKEKLCAGGNRSLNFPGKKRRTRRMAEKDIAEKVLEDTKLRSDYRAEGELHEMERDVAKRWKKNGIRIACVGFENQTKPDSRMVLRVYGYDGGEYRAQCLKENAGNPLYPVVTLVLYFGYEQRWNASKTLYEAVKVPAMFKPFVPNIKINVFEVAWLTDKQVGRFKSDFRIVADYFVQKRKTGTYKGTRDEIQHVNALIQLFRVMEQDDRFALALVDEGKEGGIRNMCDVIDRYLKEGEDKGIAIGIEKGEANSICALYESGMKPEEIAIRLKKDLSYVLTTIQNCTVA
jgi:hypothetical protein